MDYIISGIQQIGIGVQDVDRAWAWYRRRFGMDVPVFREAAEAPLMAAYTGNEVQSRDAVLALNLNGGSGMEIWQFTSRLPQMPKSMPSLGQAGILAARIKVRDVEGFHEAWSSYGESRPGALATDPRGDRHFFVRDPWGFHFDVVRGDRWFGRRRGQSGGPEGCLIGVTDVERALRLYRDVLGYDEVVYDETGRFNDWASLPGGDGTFRRILLAHSEERVGPFSQLLGPSRLELVESRDQALPHIFDGRYWGDPGFIHLCFDVRNMTALEAACREAGFPFTVDSESSFDMGAAGGRFAYVEDPDGTLIEFVETHKVPIMAKWGWYLDLRKRSPEKPLPKWMIRALGLNRVSASP